MEISRRALLRTGAMGIVSMAAARAAGAQPVPGATVEPHDRVFICNEDSNIMSVIDPRSNTVDTTINLTSFDEDPRPPFRFVTGGTIPTHAAMTGKPLYHGAIAIHGAAPSPDSRWLATTGRGSSNVYLIDTAAKKEIAVEPDGAIAAVSVIASSSHEILNRAAVDAARSVPRVPFPSDVRPRALRVRLPVVFELQ